MSRLVKDKMKRLRASNAELADEMGVHRSTISRFLSGKTKSPGRPFLLALEQALNRLESKIRAEIIGTAASSKQNKLRT